ncbi:cupin domain-containing protein [Sulfurospirillum sp. T05]|uniref:Cupin domain-containing protein n=1 Tax=Sulfurospirillum tamanense TaxID=2813362 RepID=A0ABS2WRN4_9BACT|nr:cupin domain-containing protein [Sulfurospirillum tamanensis]MBN2964332.1 cupin domain-containing protein [Sulfurospirillum tamanensis]
MKRLLFLFLLLASSVFASAQTQVVVLAKSSQSWEGSPLPAYPKEAPEISVLKITIPPHTTLPLHKHPIINVGYMVKGTLKVVTEEGEVLHLSAGDAIIEVVEKWHYGVNESDEPVEIVVVYAGTKESVYSISK